MDGLQSTHVFFLEDTVQLATEALSKAYRRPKPVDECKPWFCSGGLPHRTCITCMYRQTSVCVTSPGEGNRRRMDNQGDAKLTQLQNKHDTNVCSKAKVVVTALQEQNPAPELSNLRKGKPATMTEGPKYVLKQLSRDQEDAWALSLSLSRTSSLLCN